MLSISIYGILHKKAMNLDSMAFILLSLFIYIKLLCNPF